MKIDINKIVLLRKEVLFAQAATDLLDGRRSFDDILSFSCVDFQ